MWVKLVGRKVPDSIVKARASYQLQRGVPCDGQSHVGKKQWKEPGGTTLNEAPARGLRKRVRDEKELCSNSVAVLAWLWITIVLVKACGASLFKGLPGMLEETTKRRAQRASAAERPPTFEWSKCIQFH